MREREGKEQGERESEDTAGLWPTSRAGGSTFTLSLEDTGSHYKEKRKHKSWSERCVVVKLNPKLSSLGPYVFHLISFGFFIFFFFLLGSKVQQRVPSLLCSLDTALFILSSRQIKESKCPPTSL